MSDASSHRNPIEVIGLSPELALVMRLHELRALMRELYLEQVRFHHPDLNEGRHSDRLIELQRAYEKVRDEEGLYRHLEDLRTRHRSFHDAMDRCQGEIARLHAEQERLSRLAFDCIHAARDYRDPSGDVILFDYGRALNDVDPFSELPDLVRKAVRPPGKCPPEVARRFVRKIGVAGRRIEDAAQGDRRERTLVATIVLQEPSELDGFPEQLVKAGLAARCSERPPWSFSTRSFDGRNLIRLALQPGLELRFDVPLEPKRTFLISATNAGADTSVLRFALEGLYLRSERRRSKASEADSTLGS